MLTYRESLNQKRNESNKFTTTTQHVLDELELIDENVIDDDSLSEAKKKNDLNRLIATSALKLRNRLYQSHKNLMRADSTEEKINHLSDQMQILSSMNLLVLASQSDSKMLFARARTIPGK